MIHSLARQKGLTERGNTYVLTQDAPHRIHLTIQNGDYLINETLENLRSEQEMIERRNALENELIEWINYKTETPEDEANQPILLTAGSSEAGGEGMDTINPESV